MKNPYPNLNIGLYLKQEYECRQLLPIELRWFGVKPSEWPEFIPNFRNRIHEKVERLLSALEGKAKKSVESIGCE